MSWLWIILLAPALFAVSNYIDKLLLERYFKHRSPGVLVLFSSLIGLLVVPIIFVVEPNVLQINPVHATLLIVSGALYIVALIPYLTALAEEETSIVVPMFQTIPVFAFLLGYIFLHETLSPTQIGAGLVIIGSAMGLSLDITRPIPRIKGTLLALMLGSSFIFSLNMLIFKYAALEAGFWVTAFWEYLGSLLVAILLVALLPTWRREFREVLHTSRRQILGLNLFNEIINVLGMLAISYASLLVPLALAALANSFHPVFVLLFGLVLTLFFPRLLTEKLTPGVLVQKILFIGLICLGTYWLTRV